MAIRGKSFIKTSWAFQERPVASAKLNTWDDRIEAALELLMNLVSLAWGGGDGVLRNAPPAIPASRPRPRPPWASASRRDTPSSSGSRFTSRPRLSSGALSRQ